MEEEHPAWHAPHWCLQPYCTQIPRTAAVLEGLEKGSLLHLWNPTSTKALGQLLQLLPKALPDGSHVASSWEAGSYGVCQKVPGSWHCKGHKE